MNSAFWFGIYLGGGVVVLLALMYIFAVNNVFFTLVREGRAKAVLRFGKFHRLIMTYAGYGFDQRWALQELTRKNEAGEDTSRENEKITVKDEDGKVIDQYNINFRTSPFHIGGLYWVGIPFVYTVHEYDFRWVSFEQGEKEGELIELVRPHDERLDYILLQDDVYYVLLHQAETDGMVQADVKFLVAARIVNPYRSLFWVQNWLEASQNLIKEVLRRFIAQKTYEKLVKSEGLEELNREANEFMKQTKIANYLERTYGVRLKRVGFVHIDPAGERAKNYVEAASKQWEAEKEAQRILTLADAEKKRMETVYETVQKYGDVGVFLKGTEMLQEVGKGPSNLVVFPIGSAQDLLTAVTGKKKEPLIFPSSKGGA